MAQTRRVWECILLLEINVVGKAWSLPKTLFKNITIICVRKCLRGKVIHVNLQ